MKQQKYIRYILLPTTLLCLIASLFCGCSANSGKISKTGFYFDTMITVTLYGTRDEKILDDCFSLAGNYEKKLSNTITDSEVSKINQANGQFVTVSSDTLSLIKDGIRYGKISDGAFDITMVPSRICGIFQRLQKPQNPMRTKSMHRLSLPRKKLKRHWHMSTIKILRSKEIRCG